MPHQKPPKLLTSDELYILQTQSEQELGCLQRQYSLIEKDRHQYLGGFKLSRLKNILSIFRNEHQNIEDDLEVVTAPAKKKEDSKVSEHLNELLDENDDLEKAVTEQRQHLQEIDAKIQIAEKDVVKLRSQQTTDRQHEQRVWQAIKTMEGLENKLDVQNKKFGTICAHNREMKQQIDRLLWEREIFMKIWNKMIHKLVLGKRFMMDLIEQATIAYDQRERWCSKLQALRLKAHYDLVLHTQQMRELKRKQDSMTKLEKFFDIKGQRRVMHDLQIKEKLKRMDNEKRIKARLKEYNQYLNDILEFTEEKKVATIARKYYNQESENFSLFMHINDLIQTLEVLNDQLGNRQLEIENERLVVAQRELQQRNTLEDLECELTRVAKETEDAEKELKSVENYLEQMRSGIDSLFKICRCDKDPILQLLEDGTKIHNYNVFFYLELIEKKIHEAIVEVTFVERTMTDQKRIPTAQRIIKEEKKPPFYTVDQISGSTPCPLCIEYELVSDVIDTVQHVMTRAQVKQELHDRLATTELREKLHNVSACFLPKSRQIVQKRYQED